MIRLREATIEYTARFAPITAVDEITEDEACEEHEYNSVLPWIVSGTFGVIKHTASTLVWVNFELIVLPVLRQTATVIGFQLCKRLVPLVIQILVLLAAAKWFRPETVKFIASILTDESIIRFISEFYRRES